MSARAETTTPRDLDVFVPSPQYGFRIIVEKAKEDVGRVAEKVDTQRDQVERINSTVVVDKQLKPSEESFDHFTGYCPPCPQLDDCVKKTYEACKNVVVVMAGATMGGVVGYYIAPFATPYSYSGEVGALVGTVITASGMVCMLKGKQLLSWCWCSICSFN